MLMWMAADGSRETTRTVVRILEKFQPAPPVVILGTHRHPTASAGTWG